uniref:Putative secreted protein n=1 Tax=Ixodes ricinus TaxID=34613 RepID=A0A6B0UXE9_IXORI
MSMYLCTLICVAVRLKNGEVARDLFCLVTPGPVDCATSLGKYTLQWKREQWSTVASQAVALPCVEVQGCPLLVELQAPAHGSVRTPLTVSYLVHNRTLLVQDIELVMDSSDAFMYSGNKLVRGPALFLGRRREGFHRIPHLFERGRLVIGIVLGIREMHKHAEWLR